MSDSDLNSFLKSRHPEAPSAPASERLSIERAANKKKWLAFDFELPQLAIAGSFVLAAFIFVGLFSISSEEDDVYAMLEEAEYFTVVFETDDTLIESDYLELIE